MLWKFTAMEPIVTKGTYRNYSFLFAALILPFLGLCPGCGNKFFDPTQVGRFRPVPAVNVILDSLGVAEETPVAWEGAEEPLPIDTVAKESDYAFRSGDIINISIFELLREGVNYESSYVVTETGRISIPEVGVIHAAGLAETELEEEIKRKLSPNILKSPLVTATLVSSQQRAFSVLGDGVPLPGRYFLPRYDFKLTDALAMAGSPSQYNVSYVYVSRSAGNDGTTPDSLNPGYGELELKAIEPGARGGADLYRQKAPAPRAEYRWPESKVVIASSEMIAGGEYPGLRSGSAPPDNRTPGLSYSTGAGRPSNWRDTTQQSNDEQTSVEEILKTLSERSSRDTRTGAGSGIEDTLASQQGPAIRQGRTNDRLGFID
ncbi:MAG: polysaccharide biosynthesis/export family protein, partial [Planctomycetota bacterium]